MATVLVVDDHEMTRLGLRACAQAMGLAGVEWLEAGTLAGAMALSNHAGRIWCCST